MTSGVNTHVLVGVIALHAVLEGEDVFAVLDELGDDFIPRLVSRMLVYIPA